VGTIRARETGRPVLQDEGNERTEGLHDCDIGVGELRKLSHAGSVKVHDRELHPPIR
jgi:hypothetical protein